MGEKREGSVDLKNKKGRRNVKYWGGRSRAGMKSSVDAPGIGKGVFVAKRKRGGGCLVLRRKETTKVVEY